jgi:hypothetical protein
LLVTLRGSDIEVDIDEEEQTVYVVGLGPNDRRTLRRSVPPSYKREHGTMLDVINDEKTQTLKFKFSEPSEGRTRYARDQIKEQSLKALMFYVAESVVELGID